MNEKDCAIFYYDQDDTLQQLSCWIRMDRAKKLMRSRGYFTGRKKVILQRINFKGK